MRAGAPPVFVMSTSNPSDPQPHILLGSVAAAHDYDWNEAAERFRDALSATPVSADTRWAYATMYLSAFGRFDEAAAEMERAAERSGDQHPPRRNGQAANGDTRSIQS
jgi:Tfp pilus assembly protein PilF